MFTFNDDDRVYVETATGIKLTPEAEAELARVGCPPLLKLLALAEMPADCEPHALIPGLGVVSFFSCDFLDGGMVHLDGARLVDAPRNSPGVYFPRGLEVRLGAIVAVWDAAKGRPQWRKS